MQPAPPQMPAVEPVAGEEEQKQDEVQQLQPQSQPQPEAPLTMAPADAGSAAIPADVGAEASSPASASSVELVVINDAAQEQPQQPQQPQQPPQQPQQPQDVQDVFAAAAAAPSPSSASEGPSKPQGKLEKPQQQAQLTDLDLEELLRQHPPLDLSRGNPEDNASFLSFLFFSFLTPTIVLGNKRPLLEQDVFPPARRDNLRYHIDNIEQLWAEETARPDGKPSLFRAVRRFFFKTTLFDFCCQLCARASTVVTPIFVGKFLEWLVRWQAGLTTDSSEGWLWGFYLFATPVMAAFMNAHAHHALNRTTFQLCSSLSCMIFRKSMRISGSLVEDSDGDKDKDKTKDSKDAKDAKDSSAKAKGKDKEKKPKKKAPKKDKDAKDAKEDAEPEAEESATTVGQITNLMAADVTQLGMTGFQLSVLFLVPLQIGVSLYLLWDTVGKATFVGFAAMFVFGPLIAFGFVLIAKHVSKSKVWADKRIKLIHEILNGIQIVKFYAWERSFIQSVGELRQRELHHIRWMNYYGSAVYSSFTLMPIVVTMAAMGSYVAFGNDLDVVVVFKALGLFAGLNYPLVELPSCLSAIVLGLIASGRIQRFLQRPELQEDNLIREPDQADKEFAVEIDAAEFTFGGGAKAKSDSVVVVEPEAVAEGAAQEQLVAQPDDEQKASAEASQDEQQQQEQENDQVPVDGKDLEDPQAPATADNEKAAGKGPAVALRDVNFHARRGKITAVIGPVGSGKSTLLRTILGELNLVRGSVRLRGSLSYVPQRAWLLNATIRENILFGAPMEPERYRATVHACALQPDLDTFQAGDLCEVGDRGISLSGGQQQRISCARSLYSGADVHLLDDCLSAVDANVAEHIFTHCIQGAMRDTTRVLVTNQLHLLPFVDEIYVMERQAIRSHGTYDQLMAEDPLFRALIDQHILGLQKNEEGQAGEAKEAQDGQDGQEDNVVLPPGSPDLQKQVSEPQGAAAAKQAGDKPQLTDEQLMQVGQQTTEEELYTGSVALDTYWQHVQGMGGLWYVGPLVLALLLGPSVAAVSPFLLTWWTEDRFDKSDSFYLWIYAAIAVGAALCGLARGLLFAVCSVKAAQRHHDSLFYAMMRATASFFDTTPTGRVLSRFSKDSLAVDYEVPNSLNSTMGLLSTIVVQMVAIVIIIWYFLPLLLLAAVLFYLLQRYYKRAVLQLQRLESRSRSPIFSHFTESLIGMEVIRAFGHRERFVQENIRRTAENFRMALMFRTTFRWVSLRMNVGQTFLVLGVCIFLILQRDDINPGLAGTALNFVLSTSSILGFFMYMLTNLEANMNSVERIQHYARYIDEEPDWDQGAVEAPADWPSRGEVRIEDAVMRYRPGLEPALRGVTLNVPGGSKFGIAGRTGSGKSTLMLCAFRLYELERGRILIDGLDISQLPLHTLRSRLGMVPQDPVCFAGTVRTNLDPFAQYPEEEIWKALGAVHLDRWVRDQEAGLEHEVREAGGNLSQGQRQQLCMARAVLRRPRLLLMDEATSAMDQATDALLQQTVAREFGDSTVLTIAHRLNTIMDSDQIAYLKLGKVREVGTPQQLVAQPDGEFAAMHAAMVRGVEEAQQAGGGQVQPGQ